MWLTDPKQSWLLCRMLQPFKSLPVFEGFQSDCIRICAFVYSTVQASAVKLWQGDHTKAAITREFQSHMHEQTKQCNFRWTSWFSMMNYKIQLNLNVNFYVNSYKLRYVHTFHIMLTLYVFQIDSLCTGPFYSSHLISLILTAQYVPVRIFLHFHWQKLWLVPKVPCPNVVIYCHLFRWGTWYISMSFRKFKWKPGGAVCNEKDFQAASQRAEAHGFAQTPGEWPQQP